MITWTAALLVNPSKGPYRTPKNEGIRTFAQFANRTGKTDEKRVKKNKIKTKD
jgi:hypothetical protein